MSKKINYEEVGLVSGIEIHQQLEGKKLFCNCPTTLREDTPDFEVKRRLKAVVGETGLIDIAAAREVEKSKFNIYQGYDDSTCLVEIDEEPPKGINLNALKLCLEVCKRFDCVVVDEIQVMRKTVVDGSNTTGFQRTSLVGHNGSFKLKSGKEIRIEGVMLEEDAAKIVEKTADYNKYNLSKLGIPLFEIVTGPQLNTPEEIKEAAQTIGMYLRSSRSYGGQSIKRGIGTIRQDINISIKGGNRTETKGTQDLKLIPTIVDFEILRQQKLIDLKKRKLKLDFEIKITDLTEIFKKTKCNFIKKTIDKGNVVMGIRIPNFKGIFGEETCPGRRVGSEISDYAKVVSGVGGLIHSDENLSKYKFSSEEIGEIKSCLSISESDAFILVADKLDRAVSALNAAHKRILRLNEGVIMEVRVAREDGTTAYMRPLPGGSRMYPETDVLPIKPDFTGVKLGESIDERIQIVSKLGIKNKDVAKKIGKEYYYDFLKLKDSVGLDPNIIASNIASGMTSKLEDTELILQSLSEGKVPRNSYLEIVDLVNNGTPVKEAISSKETMPVSEVEKIAEEVIKDFASPSMKDFGKIIGKIMAISKGKADGRVLNELLRKKLK